MSNLQDVIEKVKKLLALSKSKNANEAASAAAIANRLIDEYRLHEADILGDSEELDPFEEDSSYVYETGRVIPWKHTLLHVLTRHYGVAYWNDTDYSTGRKKTRYKLVGKKSDVQIVNYMFAWLTMECQRLSDQEAKGKGHVFVFSYCEGFVAGISEQLANSREAAKQTATSNAIIKIDARLQESKDFMYKMHSNLVKEKGKSYRQHNASAYSAGQTKGKNIHLGAAMGSGKVKLLGGKS